MKKTYSTLMLIGLMTLSLASYTYLSTTASHEIENDLALKPSTELEEQANEKVVLPDIGLVKKLLNITKIVLPRD
ncbi:MAG: hypothetical protein IT258_19895 [Saprospiraceae bacterium]|nr:hypothetical protein [Saprospiraceae bacterium]